MAILPTEEQIQRFLGSERDGPVVMLNVLRFKERADSGQGSGAEAYARYGEVAAQTVAAMGGRMLWTGKVETLLIGDDEADRYDMVALVEYPSPEALIEMSMRDDYRAGHEHRVDGLECQLLIACEGVGGPLQD